jgi:hypothetical protein
MRVHYIVIIIQRALFDVAADSDQGSTTCEGAKREEEGVQMSTDTLMYWRTCGFQNICNSAKKLLE